LKLLIGLNEFVLVIPRSSLRNKA